jgi:cell wall-associated NlpC family hydrolase
VPRDAHEQEAAAERVEEPDLRPADLVFFGPPERADHVAFWLGSGRILHATGRAGVRAVVEEEHPSELAARVRAYVRL